MTVSGSGCAFEQPAKPLVVERVPFFLQPLDLHAGFQHRAALVLLQRLDRHLKLHRRPGDHLGDERRPEGRVACPEDVEPPGRPIDQVDYVVEAGGQQVDVLAVERGDEHPVEAADYFVGDLVGLVL